MGKDYSEEIKRNIDLLWAMSDITNRTNKAVISKWSSASFWGFGNAIEDKIYLTFPRGYNLKLENNFIKTQRVTAKYLGGIETFEFKGRELKVYSPERTIVEMIKDAKGSYNDVLLEMIKNFFNKVDYDNTKLHEWASIFKIPKIVKQFQITSDEKSDGHEAKYKIKVKINSNKGLTVLESLKFQKQIISNKSVFIRELFFSDEKDVHEFLLRMVEHMTLINFPSELSLKWNTIISKQKYINVSSEGLVSYSASEGKKENNDPEYTYDGIVLKNKFKATDEKSLQNLEEKITKSSIQNHIEELRKLKWNDVDTLKKIHKAIFNDIYEWAGEYRNINISKNNTNFENYVSIKSENRRLFQETIRTKHDLISLYLKLNMVHHFREGNGRTLRLWLTIASEQLLNLTVDFSKVKPEEYMAAMETSEWNPRAVYALLDKVFVKYTAKNYMAIFMRSTDASYAYEHMTEFKMEK